MTAGPASGAVDVSVVVPARNGEAYLAAALEAMTNQVTELQWEVLVVDNGSADATVAIAETFASRLPGMRVIDASAEVGVGGTRNRGVEAAAGRYVLFCDADDIVSPRWVSAMTACLVEHDLAGGPLDVDALNPPHVRAWRSGLLPAHELPVALGFLPYAVGANLGVRRAVYMALGGFARGYERGAEDVDLCWRAQLAGYSIGFAADARIQYRCRSTLRELARQSYWYGRNEPILYRRFRAEGLERAPIRAAVRSWRELIRGAPSSFGSRALRGTWLRDVAYRTGIAAGSVRHGVLYW